MDNSYLSQLNPEQKEAVLHTTGPLLVFAGAGSGKTRVITYRIANLVSVHSVDPESILAVTFTKKAAEEMLHRIEDIFKDLSIQDPARPLIGTFHSICAQILRKEYTHSGLGPNFSIYDSSDSENMIKELMLAENIDIKQVKPNAIYSLIGSAKNDLIDPTQYSRTYSGFIEDYVSLIYPKYQQQLTALNSVDFADLLFKVVELFAARPEILAKYQERFNYVLVDEYQDTNKVQYNLIHTLSSKHENLCVVGDDDQSIYKWRGADIKNIISFEKDFKNVKIVKLEQNYRSVGNIIEAATSVIGQNEERIEKKLWTDKGAGEPILVHQARDDKDEARYVVEQIGKMRDKGYALGDMAILYRTNFQSRVIEEALLQKGLPYKLVGGFRFYDRKEIKDLLSYLRFINNPKDDLSLHRILNTPNRKMGPQSTSTLAQLATSCGMSVGRFLILTNVLINKPDVQAFDLGYSQEEIDSLNGRMAEANKFTTIFNLFGDLYLDAQHQNATEVINAVIRKTKYIEFIDDNTDAGKSRVENVEELKNVAASYVNKSPDDSLNKLLQDIALIEQEQEKNKKNLSDGSITLMTLHSSKGLEFPIVFMVGMEEGLLPHSRTFTDPTELEEERRLCYVGITRARERLWLTFAEARNKMGGFEEQIPSRFLGEIPQDICEYYSWNAGGEY